MINSAPGRICRHTFQDEAEAAYAASGLALLQRGWRVIDVPHGSKLDALWPKASRGSQGFAWRAAMAETVAGGVR